MLIAVEIIFLCLREKDIEYALQTSCVIIHCVTKIFALCLALFNKKNLHACLVTDTRKIIQLNIKIQFK